MLRPGARGDHRRPQHPARVFDMIDDFYIGELVETKKDS